MRLLRALRKRILRFRIHHTAYRIERLQAKNKELRARFRDLFSNE